MPVVKEGGQWSDGSLTLPLEAQAFLVSCSVLYSKATCIVTSFAWELVKPSSVLTDGLLLASALTHVFKVQIPALPFSSPERGRMAEETGMVEAVILPTPERSGVRIYFHESCWLLGCIGKCLRAQEVAW